jgi:hypothetical protein
MYFWKNLKHLVIVNGGCNSFCRGWDLLSYFLLVLAYFNFTMPFLSDIFLMNAGESLRAENEILRLQLVQTMKELEAEQIRRLELELLLKNKENKSLKKQNKALRAENEHYKKTVSK